MKDPCGPCGLCCRSYLVPVFGHDLARLAAAVPAPPESWLFIAEQETPDNLGFRLEVGGPTFGMALLKQGELVASQPCVFLQDVGGGLTRCEVYADRPITCRVYPMARLGRVVYQRDGTLCPPGAWDGEDLAASHWSEDLQRLRYRRDVYVEVVARWNAALAAAQPTAPAPVTAYCRFVLGAYQAIAALEEEVGGDAMAWIESGWARLPPRGPLEQAREVSAPRESEPAWLTHLRGVRAIIDRFFPEVPPQPFQRLVVEPEDGGAGDPPSGG